MGPIMLDVQGTSLSAEDKELLEHPLVGGLILFSRNYQSPKQVSALTREIRKAAKSPILIAVDQEGGRVQRFREHFSTIPAMGAIWRCADGDVEFAKLIAKNCGTLMALEVQAVGIDLSLAPVLDINGISEVIGERAFHQQPEQVIALASAFIDGMQKAGMKATGKHFPGHGSVQADSHHALPIDTRSKQQIINLDLLPFKHLIAAQKVSAIMPAHIVFPNIDSKSVGFSHYWLQEVLRDTLAFEGVIFSDDLSMEGAASIGGYIERAEAAQQAGCDMLLLCNNRQGCIEVIDNANIEITSTSSERLKTLLKTSRLTWPDLAENLMWRQASSFVSEHVFVNDKE
ncbi:MAG: beta-N-acetylhexosaminidase [Alteromonadaceae bacterium]|nr:beta-N-acetylhexosaminidase [Alteromonadaceae bacterium]